VTPPFVAAGAAEGEEDGDVEGDGGVLLVLLDVDPAAFERLQPLLRPRQGYLGARRYRDGALVRWSSPLMWARALRDPEIAAAANGIDAALYLAV
jgi:hypothetical protein